VPAERRIQPKTGAYIALFYVLLVYGLDSLQHANLALAAALGIDTSFLSATGPYGFEYFKFIAWLVIPAMVAAPTIDKRYFSNERWRRSDYYILLALIGAGLLTVALARFIPSVASYYHATGDWSLDFKVAESLRKLVWICSWLIGWEFLHRYVLLVTFKQAWPRYGWMLIPILEVFYHILQQKPGVELVFVGIGGVLLTYWAVRRRNTLLPLIVHFVIDVVFFAAMIWF
jgi:membrane protease YdiL (CAAX protease family)